MSDLLKELEAFFARVNKTLETRPVYLIRKSEGERWFIERGHPWRLSFLIAEASGAGLICQVVSQDNIEFLQFTRSTL